MVSERLNEWVRDNFYYFVLFMFIKISGMLINTFIFYKSRRLLYILYHLE